jgi:hypothetical protein
MAEGSKRKKTPAKKPAAKRAASKSPTRGTAPSSANIEDLEKFEPSEEAKQHEPSDVDAMGRDKRRSVVGNTYGPTRRRQAFFFAIAAGVAVLIVLGAIAAINAFDQPEKNYPDKAPWAQSGGADNPPVHSPSGPCGEPGNPPEFQPGTACASARTSDQGPALPGGVPRGGEPDAVATQQAGAGGAGSSSGSSGSAQ